MDLSVLGARVREARTAAGLSQERLSEALEIPRSGVSDIENGRRSLSAGELIAVSKYLRRPLDYFIGQVDEPQESEPAFAVRFRSLNLQPEDAESVFEFEQCCRDYQWLEQTLQIHHVTQPPSYPFPTPRNAHDAAEQGETLANDERNRLALGSDPVRDPFLVVESQGIRVFIRKLRTPKVTGIFHYDEELGACILVNGAVHENRRPFDLLHEYCHVLTDRPEGTHRSDEEDDPRNLTERRADAFAAAFLMPRDGIERFFINRGIVRGGDAPTQSDVFHAMVAFGASFRATVFRLRELDYLPAQHADAFLSASNITQWTERFRKAAKIASPSFDDPRQRRFGQLVLRAYLKEKISLGRVAELLGIDFDEARELVWMYRDDRIDDTESVTA